VALALAVACGSRTGLLSSGSSASSSSSGAVSFDAGCPDPLWLLFNLRDHSGKAPRSGIYAMRADGSAGHWLPLPHSPALNASVSPDGSRLLYATYAPVEDGGADSTLYAYDLATQTATAIVSTTGLTYSALSPDGKTVSYVSDYSLKAVDADGANDRLLIPGPNDQGSGYGHPVFEPDSRTIVYATGGIIGAIGTDGSGNGTLLEAIPGSLQYPNPAFSPDYQRIVVGLFCSRSSPYALRVYPFASLPGASCESGQILTTDLTEGSSPNAANDPSWGPNGLIAYASAYDVFVIDANGGSPRNMTAALTGDAGTISAADPVWAPGCAQIP
jgi:Tol biopolymer transport system component